MSVVQFDLCKIALIVAGPFLQHRSLEYRAATGAGKVAVLPLTASAVRAALENHNSRATDPLIDTVAAALGNGYLKIDAARKAPRGERARVVIAIYSPSAKETQELKKFVDAVERALFDPDGTLDEAIIIVDDTVFSRKPLVAHVDHVQAGLRSLTASARDKTAPYLSLYSYAPFTNVVPDHAIVPPHRTMSAKEVSTLLGFMHKTRADLPMIFTNDPPVIWVGAREGDVVEISRDSHTAAAALYYRRVEAHRNSS